MDFSALYAAGAHANAFVCTIYDGVDLLEVHIPAALGHVVSVADPISKLRTFAANITHFRHA